MRCRTTSGPTRWKASKGQAFLGVQATRTEQIDVDGHSHVESRLLDQVLTKLVSHGLGSLLPGRSAEQALRASSGRWASERCGSQRSSRLVCVVSRELRQPYNLPVALALSNIGS